MFTSDIWMKVNLICSLMVVGSRQAGLIQNAHLLFATTVCRANVGLYKGQFCWKECFVDEKMRGKLFICADLKSGDRWAKQAEEDLNSCWQTIEICGHRKHRLIETVQILERTHPDLVILNFCPRLQMVVTSPRQHESFLNQPSLSQQSRLLVSVGLWWRGNFSCHTEHQPQPIWVLSLTSCILLWPQSGGFQHDYKQCHKANWLKMSSEICHWFPSHCKGIQ